MKAVKRILTALLILVLAALLFVGGIRLFMVLHEKSRVKQAADLIKEYTGEDAPETYDAIVVLGASVLPDRTPSTMLRYRLDAAYELYCAGVSEKVLLSGDHRPGEYDEVDVMIEYLVVKGIPEEKLVADYEGANTYLSMSRLGEFGIQKAVVVTQNYHQYRALYIGGKAGTELTGAVAEDIGFSGDTVLRIVREWLASVKDLVNCIAGKEIWS